MKAPDIIGDKNKMIMLLSIYCEGPLKKTDIYSFLKKNSNNARKLDELEKDSLIIMTTDRFQNNITMVELTKLGYIVADKLAELSNILANATILSPHLGYLLGQEEDKKLK